MFYDVTSHSAFKAAVAAGAVPIWMPRLFPAKTIEAERLSFARAAVIGELGPMDVSKTHNWMSGMEKAFAPIASWLP